MASGNAWPPSRPAGRTDPHSSGGKASDGGRGPAAFPFRDVSGVRKTAEKGIEPNHLRGKKLLLTTEPKKESSQLNKVAPYYPGVRQNLASCGALSS